jgi:elongation of very long chain fatty acids protein 7
MANRPAYKLRKTIMFYNFLQVMGSVALFVGSVFYAWGGKYNWRCEPCSKATDEETMQIVGGTWWYFFSKFTEFFDTHFFVMRKRFDLVSNLHVIHHGIMPFAG